VKEKLVIAKQSLHHCFPSKTKATDTQQKPNKHSTCSKATKHTLVLQVHRHDRVVHNTLPFARARPHRCLPVFKLQLKLLKNLQSNLIARGVLLVKEPKISNRLRFIVMYHHSVVGHAQIGLVELLAVMTQGTHLLRTTLGFQRTTCQGCPTEDQSKPSGLGPA
jgi:hypothetical protein